VCVCVRGGGKIKKAMRSVIALVLLVSVAVVALAKKSPVVTDVKVEYGRFYNSISERDSQPFRFCSPVLMTFTLANADLTKDMLSIRRTAHIVTEKNDNKRTEGQLKPKFSHNLKSVEYSPSADTVVCDGKNLKIRIRDCPGPSALSVVGDPTQYPMFFKGLFDVVLVYYPTSPGEAGLTLAELSYETSSGKLSQTDNHTAATLYRPAEITKGPFTFKNGLRKFVETLGVEAPQLATDKKHYFQCLYNLGSVRTSGHEETDVGELDSIPCPTGCKRSALSSSSVGSSDLHSHRSSLSLSRSMTPASTPLFEAVSLASASSGSLSSHSGNSSKSSNSSSSTHSSSASRSNSALAQADRLERAIASILKGLN